ncbi:MAG: UDP-glucose 4-epimerase GalE [Porticoccaceae bacterium]
MTATVLVTGGAGYIGSHTVVELLNAGYGVIVVDNLTNSNARVFDRIAQITGKKVNFVRGDIRDRKTLESLFDHHPIEVVIHFAGLKAVGESVAAPLRYYDNNLIGAINLFEVMADYQCKRLVFSSSATVYGDPEKVPIQENFPLGATNPYGQSKLMIETLLRDLAASDNAWKIMALRYFNPVGAHASGLIGENPRGIPNNLLPFIAQVAIGQRPELQIFGGDYATADGTGVRDYIHVVDLAEGHLAAMAKLSAGFDACNLGAGRGYSVLEVVDAFSRACGKTIPYKIVARRPGDIAEAYADTSYSFKRLGWRARRTLAEMVVDHWRWQQQNSNGYG